MLVTDHACSTMWLDITAIHYPMLPTAGAVYCDVVMFCV